jgi:hypothetical protein
MYILRKFSNKYKYIIILMMCTAVLQSGCATTNGYGGYAGYHTYKMDATSSKKLAVLLAFLGPVMTIPLVYAVNEFYLHNRVIKYLFTTAGLDSFFKALGDFLL